MRMFFVHYGFSERLHSDQGAKLTLKLIAELSALAGLRQSRATLYYPIAMGNTVTERLNQTLLQMFGTPKKDRKSD